MADKTPSTIRMIALDLDGTTLNNAHELSEKTKEVLRRLSRKGFIIAIATGRSISTITKYVDELDLEVPVPIICFNGSIGFTRMARAEVSRLLFSNPMREASCREVIAFSERHEHVIQYYNGFTGEILANPRTEKDRELMKRYADLVGHEQTVVSSFDETIQGGPSAKLIILMEDPDELIRLAKEELKGSYNMIKGASYFAEFLESDMSKGAGLLQMCKQLEVKPEEVVAFGDGDNDVEFLQYAGWGVAMKNGGVMAKSAANDITERTNDEDGMALYLEKLEEIGFEYRNLK